MTIGAIVTRGFGPADYSNVNFVPTRGYLSSSLPNTGAPSGIRRLSLYAQQLEMLAAAEREDRRVELEEEEDAIKQFLEDFFIKL